MRALLGGSRSFLVITKYLYNLPQFPDFVMCFQLATSHFYLLYLSAGGKAILSPWLIRSPHCQLPLSVRAHSKTWMEICISPPFPPSHQLLLVFLRPFSTVLSSLFYPHHPDDTLTLLSAARKISKSAWLLLLPSFFPLWFMLPRDPHISHSLWNAMT